MADVSLDLDPAMIDNLRREAGEHGFEDVDGYVEWLLGHRDTVLNEHDVWDAPPGGDLDADLGQSSGPSLDPDRSGASASADELSLEPEGSEGKLQAGGDETGESSESEADPDSPEEDAADDDDVAAALEEIDLDDE